MGVGGIFRYVLRLGCFRRVAVGEAGCRCWMYIVELHTGRVCDRSDSTIVSDLMVRDSGIRPAWRRLFSVGLDSSGTRVVSCSVRWYEWRARCGYVVEMSWTAARGSGSWGWVTGE
jgi:hypothetical protein